MGTDGITSTSGILTTSSTSVDADVKPEGGREVGKTPVKGVETMPPKDSVKSRINSQPGLGIKSIGKWDPAAKRAEFEKKGVGPGGVGRKTEQTLPKQGGQPSGDFSAKLKTKIATLKESIGPAPSTDSGKTVDADVGDKPIVMNMEELSDIVDKLYEEGMRLGEPLLEELERCEELMDAIVEDAQKEVDQIHADDAFLKSLDEFETFLDGVSGETRNELEEIADSPEARHLERLTAEFGKLLATKGDIADIAGDSPKDANALMATAANARELAVDILAAHKSSFPPELRKLTRQEISGDFMLMPLARLPAVARQQVVQLRELHQNCMLRLNGMADKTAGETAMKLISERHDNIKAMFKEMKATLDNCEMVLAAPNKFIPNREAIRAVINLAANPPRGENIDRNHPAIAALLADLAAPEHAEVKGRMTNDLELLFEGMKVLQDDLPKSGVTERNYEAFYALNVAEKDWGLDVIKFNKKRTDGQNMLEFAGIIDRGLKVLHRLSSGIAIADCFNPEHDALEAKTFIGVENRLRRAELKFRPSPFTGLRRMVDGIVQGEGGGEKLTGSAAKNLMASVAWKFERTLRADVKSRIISALATNPGRQIKKAVDQLPLGFFDKRRLVRQLEAVQQRHIIAVPTVTPENTFDSGGYGVLVGLTVDGKEALAKKNRDDETAKTSSFVREMIMHDIFQNNPNAPRIIGIGSDKKTGRKEADIYLVMEKVPGKNLSQYMVMADDAKDNRMPDDLLLNLPIVFRKKVAAHLLRGAVLGLAPMHEAGYGHFDIKPQNIMLDSNSLEARLIDFGLAAKMDKNTIAGGSKGFQSREGDYKRVLPEDVFALGICLMEMACGDYGDPRLDFGPNIGKFQEHMLAKPDMLKPEMSDIRDIAKMLTNSKIGDRPTMRQLKEIFTKGTVTPAPEGEDGVKGADAELLRKLLAPDGDLAGGRELLASRMK